MNKQKGITLITVIIMVIIIGVIASISMVSSRIILDESKEEVLTKNRFLVEAAVSKYSAKAATSGTLSPANYELPGVKNPTFEYIGVDDTGAEIREQRNVGENWYLLLSEHLESMGITYVEENYLVNYKKNIVIPLSGTESIFKLVEYYEKLN